MKKVWLSGWYDPELIDFWEEFVAYWEDAPPFGIGHVYFPPSYYSHDGARNFVKLHALKEVGHIGYREAV